MLLLPVASTANNDIIPELTSNTDMATAGFFKLSWQGNLGPVEIQESRMPDFVVSHSLFPGGDNATVISGKPDGDWYYRARLLNDTSDNDWSDTQKVIVKHHSLERAVFFFLTGLLMFIATCLLVFRGEKLS